jgi:Na+/H+ antiporter NhaD/arsenite permease-like protein
VTQAARHNLTEFVEVFLFLLCAMTFINTMQQLNVFARMRMWLVEGGFSYRSCFWITGLIAFWLSPIADNLTTAVLMGAVVSSLGQVQPNPTTRNTQHATRNTQHATRNMQPKTLNPKP